MKTLLYIGHPQSKEESEPLYHSFQKKYDCTFFKLGLYGDIELHEYGRSFDIIYQSIMV